MALERIGMNDVKAGFDMYKQLPYYALFESSTHKEKTGQLLFSYIDGDREGEGWQMLQQNLKVIETNGPSDIHILRFYADDVKKINSATEYAGSFRFRMEPATGIVTRGGAGGNMDLLEKVFNSRLELWELKREHEAERIQREHDEEIANMQAAQESEAGEEIGAIGVARQVVDVIGEAGEKFPWLQDNLNRFFGHVNDFLSIAKFKMGNGMGDQSRSIGKIPAMNETKKGTASERIDQAITILAAWYAKQLGDMNNKDNRIRGVENLANDLELLASLTADDEVMNLALSKLRKIAS